MSFHPGCLPPSKAADIPPGRSPSLLDSRCEQSPPRHGQQPDLTTSLLSSRPCLLPTIKNHEEQAGRWPGGQVARSSALRPRLQGSRFHAPPSPSLPSCPLESHPFRLLRGLTCLLTFLLTHLQINKPTKTPSLTLSFPAPILEAWPTQLPSTAHLLVLPTPTALWTSDSLVHQTGSS